MDFKTIYLFIVRQRLIVDIGRESASALFNYSAFDKKCHFLYRYALGANSRPNLGFMPILIGHSHKPMLRRSHYDDYQ
jgi:hypothetical protein